MLTRFSPARHQWLLGTVITALTTLAGSNALAGPSITNGSFSQSTAEVGGTGTNINNSNLTGWNVGNCLAHCGEGNQVWVFLATPDYSMSGVLDDGAAPIHFWTTPGASPDGGNAITADAGNELGALEQTISGLTIGTVYQVAFYQASMQAIDAGATTPFTADWQVGFGGQTKQSPPMMNAYQGDTPWTLVTMDFEATSTSELLSFLAYSPNSGEPPFLLLDGVSLADVPEPGSLAMLLAGAGGLMLLRRKRSA